MILHVEFKIVFSHFVHIGTHGTFHVFSWKSVFLFRLSKLIEDEYVVWYLEDLQIWLEGFCPPSVYIFQFRICHFVFVEVRGTFKTPCEKFAFVKVRWKVSTRYLYYRWKIWFDGSCLSFVWSSDKRSSYFVFKSVHQIWIILEKFLYWFSLLNFEEVDMCIIKTT